MGSLVSILKLVAIGVLGYIVIALGQTLVLELLLGGQLAVDSPPAVLAAATLGTIASGVLGGTLAAWLGGTRLLLHTSIVVVLLALDAVYVLAGHRDGDPIWFDLGGAVTLMLATACGGWLRSTQRGWAGQESNAASQISTWPQGPIVASPVNGRGSHSLSRPDTGAMSRDRLRGSAFEA